MVRPGRDRIGGKWPVEVNETWVGGKTRGEGRGVHQKTLVVGAVEVRDLAEKTRREKIRKRSVYAGRMRLLAVSERTGELVTAFVTASVEPGTIVVTDGFAGYDTHHGVSSKHLQAYLNEYVFRFNRRFYPMTSFNSVLDSLFEPILCLLGQVFMPQVLRDRTRS